MPAPVALGAVRANLPVPVWQALAREGQPGTVMGGTIIWGGTLGRGIIGATDVNTLAATECRVWVNFILGSVYTFIAVINPAEFWLLNLIPFDWSVAPGV